MITCTKSLFAICVLVVVTGRYPAVVASGSIAENESLEDHHCPALRGLEVSQDIALCANPCTQKCLEVPKKDINTCADTSIRNSCNLYSKANKEIVKKQCLDGIACIGGKRCLDKLCAKNGNCCSDQKKCTGKCITVEPGKCCPTERPCASGICVGLNKCCPEENPCRNLFGALTSCVLNGDCCPGMHHCSDGISCVAANTCCTSTDRTPVCNDGTCAMVGACCLDEDICTNANGEVTSCVPMGTCCPGNSLQCCGNNQCDFGETAQSCPQDCSAQAQSFIEEAVSVGLPHFELELFPQSTILQIIEDSPNGFIGGMPGLTSDRQIESSPLIFEANSDGSLRIHGTFVPDGTPLGAVPNVPPGTVARVYSPYGVLKIAEALVDLDGSYEILLTDIGLGVSAYLLVFTPPPGGGGRILLPGRSGKHQVHRSTMEATSVPTVFRCLNNECPSSVTFKLTWEGSSDVDLYVEEPTGMVVSYQNKFGEMGFLDVDDRDGYGPEHYYYNLQAPPIEGSVFQAFVNLFSLGRENPPVSFTLRAYRDGKEVEVLMGQLQNRGDNSTAIRIEIDNSSDSDQCTFCGETTAAVRRHLGLIMPRCVSCEEHVSDQSSWSRGIVDSMVAKGIIQKPIKETGNSWIPLMHLYMGMWLKDGFQPTADFDSLMNEMKGWQDGDLICIMRLLRESYCLIGTALHAADYVQLVDYLTHTIGLQKPGMPTDDPALLSRMDAKLYFISEAESELNLPYTRKLIDTMTESRYIPDAVTDFISKVRSQCSTNPCPDASAVCTSRPTLKEGSPEPMFAADVVYLQCNLNRLNNAGLEKDGIFGPLTKKAVVNWQGRLRIKTDGIVGCATWFTLCGLATCPNDSFVACTDRPVLSTSLQYAYTRATVDLQCLLSSRGAETSGCYDEKTKSIVRGWQGENGLAQTGEVRTGEWAKLCQKKT